MLNAKKTGFAVGFVLGGWHLAWSILVAAGIAQPILNFLFWIHFITPVYTVERFQADRALILVAVALTLGYVSGAIFAGLWNRLHR
ncbi:MAG: hypothetical protein AB7E79_07635 [Rhodospirillaceae bacterium]